MTSQPQEPPSGLKTVVSARSRIISAAHSPLAFFVLALLIVEMFLLGSGALFGLSDSLKIFALCLGVLLFLAVFITVVWLVVRHPQNLVFGEESHVQYAAMKMFGDEKQRVTGSELDALPHQPSPEPPTGQLSDKPQGD